MIQQDLDGHVTNDSQFNRTLDGGDRCSRAELFRGNSLRTQKTSTTLHAHNTVIIFWHDFEQVEQMSKSVLLFLPLRAVRARVFA